MRVCLTIIHKKGGPGGVQWDNGASIWDGGTAVWS